MKKILITLFIFASALAYSAAPESPLYSGSNIRSLALPVGVATYLGCGLYQIQNKPVSDFNSLNKWARTTSKIMARSFAFGVGATVYTWFLGPIVSSAGNYE